MTSPRPTATAALETALAEGVTFVDTADVYGDGRSERIVGRVIAGLGGKRPFVATKMGRRVAQLHENYTPAHFREWIDRSRENLGLDTLDLVQLHCPPSAVIADDALFDDLDTLVDERRIGGLRRQRRDLRSGTRRDRAARTSRRCRSS